MKLRHIKIGATHSRLLISSLLPGALLLGVLSSVGTATAEKIGIGLPAGVSSLDPFEGHSLASKAVYATLASRLTALRADGSTQLDIASSLRNQNASREWFVSIPDGLTYPSGRSLSVEELVKSLELFTQRYGKSFAKDELRSRLDRISSISVHLEVEVVPYRTVERKQLKITLTEADPKFDQVLAQIPIIDTNLWNEFGQFAGNGTLVPVVGPFVVKESGENKITRLEKNQRYFKPGLPKSQSVRFIAFEDDVAALRALRVGSVDLLVVTTPEILKKAMEDRSLRILTSPLCLESSPCSLPSEHWGKNPLAGNRIISDKIVVRSSLELDEQFRGRLDVSGLYWNSTASIGR